jgi:hypothetical protein
MTNDPSGQAQSHRTGGGGAGAEMGRLAARTPLIPEVNAISMAPAATIQSFLILSSCGGSFYRSPASAVNDSHLALSSPS